MHDPESAYAAFHTQLRRYLARRLASPEDVDDVLQDVFVRVTRNRDSLRAARDPLAWLHTVAKTAAIDHVRGQKKHTGSRSDQVIDEVADALPAQSNGDFAVCLAPLVESLPAKYRDAIRFVDIEGGRQTEFAAETGMSATAVKSRVQRGRRRLKAAIMSCCSVERDALDNVSGLDWGDCDPTCC